MKIALYPGHVGKDSGAIDTIDPLTHDNYHTIEAVVTTAITSKVARYLKDLGIEHTIGIGDFESRIMATMDCQAGISIHCDSCSDNKVSGFHVIHYPRSTKGFELAKSIDRAMNVGFKRARKVHSRNNLYILRKTNFPCVLIETGFISNSVEESVLLREEYQYKIAFSIINGLLSYLS